MAAKRRTCPKCGKTRITTQYKSPRARICTPCQKQRTQAYSREQHLLETYGLSLNDYTVLFEAQGGKCFICKGARTYNLHVDHCHKTGRIRGLLCKMCNKRLLPSVRDDVARLKRAILYLEQPPCDDTLGVRTTPSGR